MLVKMDHTSITRDSCWSNIEWKRPLDGLFHFVYYLKKKTELFCVKEVWTKYIFVIRVYSFFFPFHIYRIREVEKDVERK